MLNVVYDVFECKISLTFDGENFAALAKLRTEPYAAVCRVSLPACKIFATFVVQVLKGI